ncbi:MAG: ATP-binding protein [Gemmatimonadales bacterium]
MPASRNDLLSLNTKVIAEAVSQPLVVLDEDLIIQSVNSVFYELSGLSPADTIGGRIDDLGPHWRMPELRQPLTNLALRGIPMADQKIPVEIPGKGLRHLRMTARALPAVNGGRGLLLLAIEDETGRVEEESFRREHFHRVLDIEERERHRLALEIHDETGQHVTAFLLGLEALRQSCGHTPEALEIIGHLEHQAREMAKHLAGVTLQLRPSALDQHGLESAIRDLTDQLGREGAMEVDFIATGWELGRAPLDIETALYRVAQESITNVLKHARAAKLSIVLERSADRVQLVVEDDGQGFEPDRIPLLASGPPTGLTGMRERVAMLGGALSIESAPGGGTSIIARVPLSPMSGAFVRG